MAVTNSLLSCIKAFRQWAVCASQYANKILSEYDFNLIHVPKDILWKECSTALS